MPVDQHNTIMYKDVAELIQHWELLLWHLTLMVRNCERMNNKHTNMWRNTQKMTEFVKKYELTMC